jgi:hypothetical protein
MNNQLVDQDLDAMPVRRWQEYDQAFRGQRDGSSYICPVKEQHGTMTREQSGDRFTCYVLEGGANRICSSWTTRELNPRMEFFVTGSVETPKPVAPVAAPTVQDTTKPLCLCGCGDRTKGGRFKPGHDARWHAAQKAAHRS